MKKQIEKAITWQQLKDFCNSLPVDELQKEVITQGDEVSHKIMFVEQLDDDWVDDGDGHCMDKSEFIKTSMPALTQKEIYQLEVKVPKGTAFLYTNEY